MLHCEVLQLPHSIGCGYGWYGMPGIGGGGGGGGCACACACEVRKMAKDIGMTIHKGIAVSFLSCLVTFWGFHPYMFLKCFFVTCFFVGRRKV